MSKRIWAQAWRIARRELRGGVRGFRIFLACLALGVAVIAGIGSLRASIEGGLEREGRALLGGDAELTFTYRTAEPAEFEWMNQIATAYSEIIDFRSMAVVDEERSLTQVKAIDNLYPLVGAVQLSPEMPLGIALQPDEGLPGAVMERALADRLGLTTGETFTLGNQDFRLSALLIVEPDAASAGFTLAPRTLVHTEALANSGLLAPGTLFSSKYRLHLPADSDMDALKAASEAQFADTGLRWRDARNAAPGIRRFVDRLAAFLVLVGLSGLAVGGVGISAAVRAYLATKTATIAMLRTLGADRNTIFLSYFLQIAVISALGITLGLLVGGILPLALGPVIEAALPFPAEIDLAPRALLEAALYGVLTAFLFTLWPLARAEQITAATLLRDRTNTTKQRPAFRYLIITACGMMALVGLASWFTGSMWLTIWMALGLIGALMILWLAAWMMAAFARFIQKYMRGHPSLRWALSQTGNNREAATATVIALGLGLTVLAAIGQIDGNMRRAIQDNLPDQAPSYFFVDIQRDQMPAFLQRVEQDPKVSRVENAPMLRGIITRINGQPARDVAGDHWVIRGDRGVSYAGAQPPNTSVTAGTWWSEDYTGKPQISFAAEEAEEIGLELGDEMTVNILGRDITATVTSFREVDFSTAGMGFILVMNEAALKAAPHSFIATVYAQSEAETQILRDIAQAMPNVTAIRMRDAIDRIAGILEQLASATGYGAAATLLTGFLVLLGTAAAEEPSRRYEAAVLKTLGASRLHILFSFALRTAYLGAAAALVALIAGIAAAWAVNTYVFDAAFTVIWSNVLLILSAGVGVSLLAGLVFAHASLKSRPAQILRTKD
ncbi:ABC transporter permease [Epibacterium ulvae]|uniref:ABC transporter permease n=1 Tax=Epibacterium ulvae TaxID=1156985 RepID=UPI0024937048|nr:FtsX-like permease family protein [Epibacterium ulvae]